MEAAAGEAVLTVVGVGEGAAAEVAGTAAGAGEGLAVRAFRREPPAVPACAAGPREAEFFCT